MTGPGTSRQTGSRVSLSLTLLVATAFVMDQLDGSIVNNAAPSIARDFGVAPARIALTITAYLVTLASLIPLSGWIADRFGARRVFSAAVLVFTLGSILCATSQSLGMLVGMRVLQAAGGALMVPVGRLVVLRSTAKPDLIRAIAFLTWPALIAPVLAPVLSGVFTTYLTWRWIFLVNVPIGLVVLGWARLVVPDVRGLQRRPLDWVGSLLTIGCFGSLTYAASLLSQDRIPVTLAVITAASGVLFGVAALLHLRRGTNPLLDLQILRVRTFRLSHASGSVFRLTVLGLPFLLPLLFQVGFGWSPIRAGSVVLFVFVGNIAIKPFTTPLLRTLGFRTVIVTAVTVMALGIAGCAALGPGTPVAVVALVLAVGGMSRSLGFSAYNTIAFSDVPEPRMSYANTLASTIQQLALGFGVAAASVALRIGEALRGIAPDSDLTPYRIALVLIALVTLSSVVEALRLPADAGVGIGGAAPRRRRSTVPAQTEVS